MKIAKFFSLIAFVIMMGSTVQAQMNVMTYNIKYANENDGENSWSFRKSHITNQLKFYEPEIFGVQEALLSQLEHFKESLQQYEYIGVGRNDGMQTGEFSAIFYKSEMFTVLEKGTFWLSETPSKPSIGWDAAYERICTYALFQKVDSEEKFWVFNTHFDHVGETARQNSAALILKKIKELNKEDYPVILTGDLNLEPDSEPVKLITKTFSDSRGLAENVTFGPEGTFNNFQFQEPVTRRIDYVFTSPEIEVLKYAVLTDSKDLRYPSDHFPVFVRLQLK